MKYLKYSLYLILPLCFFMVIHLTFAYGNYSLDMATWEGDIRALSAFLGFTAFVFGIFLAHRIIITNKS